jgi:hypothetical protein
MASRWALLAIIPFGVVAACGSGGLGSGFSDADQKKDASGSSNPGDDPGDDIVGDGDQDGGGDAACAAITTKAKKAEVDIIFVIDTSGSMSQEITQIRTNINAFSQKIGNSGLDYRVIMLARRGTGSYDVCVPAPLGGAGCADNAPRFFHKPIAVESWDSLSLIISSYPQWRDHLRQDAYKVFVEVTDDNAQGSYLTSGPFDTQLLALQPAGMFGTAQARKYIFDSIVGWLEGTAPLSTQKCSSAVNIGAEYQKLSQLTGGLIDSVCKTDYSGVLDNLAKGIVSKLGCDFAIPKPNGGAVDPDKVVVKYTPSSGAARNLVQVTDASKCGQVADGWYYDNNASPTRILFCPTTCSQVGADTSGQIDVLLGCKAPPPR